MAWVIGLLFLVIPLVEIYLIVQVGASLGVLPTIALLILISVVGGWLVKREGVSVIARVRRDLAAGRMPTDGLVDGALILGAGTLLLTPGFLTDIFGVLLLLPPIRAVVRKALILRYRGKATTFVAGSARRHFGSGRFGTGRYGDLITIDDEPQPRPTDAPPDQLRPGDRLS